MVSSPFFTDLDPSERLSGSRDPLGVQAVWSVFGRTLVSNLTLACNDVASVRTLLLGYLLAERYDDVAQRRELFLRWEQLAAACRIDRDDTPPIGARRATARVQGKGDFVLSARKEQILSDQTSTGIWGLYQRPLRDSGLVDGQRRLTDRGREIAHRLLPHLQRAWIDKVRTENSSVRLRSGAGQQAQELFELLRYGAGDRDDLYATLAEGRLNPHAERQDRVAARLAHQPSGLPFGQQRVQLLHDDAQLAGDTDLARCVGVIQDVESVLVPLAAVFDHVLDDGNGMSPLELANRFAARWSGVPASIADISTHRDVVASAVGGERADVLVGASTAAREGRWDEVVQQLVTLNRLTMGARGGNAWVEELAGVLTVKLRQPNRFVEESDIIGSWRNPYYLTPLLSLLRDLSMTQSVSA